MTEKREPDQREIKTDGGRYIENLGTYFENLIINLIGEEKQPENKRDKTQQTLLDWVKHEVAARLDQSLHNRVSILLEKEEDPSQVIPPWAIDVKIGTHQPFRLPSNTTITDIYEREDIKGRLLILGAPGSGKTTTLLQLAQVLIIRVQSDINQPIPVLLNLSSWKDDKQSIKDWIWTELTSKYKRIKIRKDIAKKWLQDETLIPLLDGLDELASSRQEICVKALNQFLESEWSSNVVVCSRTEEYQHYSSQLELNGSIILQPLSQKQVQDYVQRTEGEELWLSIRDDDNLMELAKTPLLLNIIVISCEEISFDKWQNLKSSQERLSYLFDAYIRRMLVRQYKGKKPKLEKVKQWLKWLSIQLINENNTEFFIEYIHPYYLKSDKEKMIFGGIVGVISGVILGFILGLISPQMYVIHWLNQGFYFWLINGLIFGLILGMIGGLNKDKVPSVETLKKYLVILNKFRKKLIYLLISLLIVGMIAGLIFWGFYGMIFVLILGLTVGMIVWGLIFQPIYDVIDMLIYGRLYDLIGIVNKTKITPLETIKISLVFFRKEAIILPIFVFVFGLYGLIFGRIVGLIVGLILGLMLWITGGITGDKIEIKTSPNQGIKASLKNMIRLTFIPIIISGIMWILIQRVLEPIVSHPNLKNLNEMILIVLGLVIAVNIFKSGLPIIQHFSLRVVLWLSGYAPWNYARFLNYATDRLFLQRVGGGYRFIHRLLQEHFSKIRTSHFIPSPESPNNTSSAGHEYPLRGDDLILDLSIDFREAVFGVEKKIQIPQLKPCNTCKGSGFQSNRLFQFSCSACNGGGRVEQHKKLIVTIPAGVDNGTRLRIAGEGDAGQYGGLAGDLYIYLFVDEDEKFKRDNTEILSTIEISQTQATSGYELNIDTIDGSCLLEIPPGIRNGTVLHLEGRGVPHLKNPLVRGDHLVTVKIR